MSLEFNLCLAFDPLNTENSPMKRNTTTRTCLAAIAALTFVGSSQAEIVFFDDFESPEVEATYTVGQTSRQIGSDWVRTAVGFRSNDVGIIDEAENGGNTFTDPTGSQAVATRFRQNAGFTTAKGVIGSVAAGQIITVKFDAVVDAWMRDVGAVDPDGAGPLGPPAGFTGSVTGVRALLVLFDESDSESPATRNDQAPALPFDGTSAVLAQIDTDVSETSTAYQSFSFTYTVGDNVIDANGSASGTPTAWDPALLGQDLAVRFATNHYAIIDNVEVSIIPEPGSLALMGLGGLLIARRRRG